MKLLIVESPNKVEKIQGILGSDFRVMASVGHVRDLPENDMGVSAPEFEPHYVATARGKSVLAKLGAAAKDAEIVYLATDPDREGEAIAWHLREALGLKNSRRVTFSEITEQAVKNSFNSVRDIDENLVAAQAGRRVLDRMVGYLVSPALSRSLGGKLSAGRVQSPALRLVVEREREIRAHKTTTHYGVELLFDAVPNISSGWKAVWNTKPFLEADQDYFLDRPAAEAVARIRSVTVVDCKESESRAAPPAPFTTSSLQQAASNALKFTPKKTMELAQSLFAAGHITYHRTDSPNLSQEAISSLQEFCRAKGWPVLARARVWKSRAGAQEAHEAIRPTHIEVEEAGANRDEKAVYALIRRNILACQLEDAVFSVRVAQLRGDAVNGRDTFFEARGRTLLSPGWKVALKQDQTEEDEEEADNPVPALRSGQSLMAGNGRLLTKQTKASKRYSLASLVRALEQRGIGRPATYAAILDNIMTRDYVRVEKDYLASTASGESVIDALVSRFSFLEYQFTAELENGLDAIAEGRKAYLEIMRDTHARLEKELSEFVAATSHPCPKCGRPLIHRQKNGQGGYDFWGCSGWPDDCAVTCENVNGKPGKVIEKAAKPEPSAFTCPDCGKALVRRQGGKKDGKGTYDLYGCLGYPKCSAGFPVAEDGGPDFGKKFGKN